MTTSRFRRTCFVVLSVISALSATERSHAQTASDTATPTVARGRLRVRPREMATGTRTLQAGVQAVDSIPGYFVYAPRQCVGTRRCPLLVMLHGGGGRAIVSLFWQRHNANRYGMIVLAPQSVNEHWYMTPVPGDSTIPDVRNLDAALRQVLRRFAIDPEKIALAGSSDGGAGTAFIGARNLDVFSRIGLVSSSGGGRKEMKDMGSPHPRTLSTQFWVSAGSVSDFLAGTFADAQSIRNAGYPVVHTIFIKPHAHNAEEYALMGQWLHESWAQPMPAVRPMPTPNVDPGPVLTTAILERLGDFWTRLRQEPDTISEYVRRRTVKEFPVSIGQARLSVVISDMVALAAKFPSVAADLKAAGVTAQQVNAYRVAYVCAVAAREASEIGVHDVASVTATSALGQNMAFLAAHARETEALQKTGIWTVH